MASLPQSARKSARAATRSERLEASIAHAVDYLFASQHPDGHWLGELEGDTILESEYIILMRFLGRGSEIKLRKAAAYILSKQLENGGWALYPGGPTEVSSSVKAYFALKMTGHSPDEPCMVKAREAIWNAGGVPAVNSYTKFYLAMLGQIPWEDGPAVPPEIVLLPDWFPFNIYEISSWSRTFVVPLSIIWSRKPVTQLGAGQSIDELFRLNDRNRVRARIRRPFLTWRNFFLAVDYMIKLAERLRLLPWRRGAVRQAKKWMLQHMNLSSGLGAIFPPIVYSLIALRCLDYPDDHPEVVRAMTELENLEIEERQTMRLQPCMSPVWDTAIAVNALAAADVAPDHPAMLSAAEWLVGREVRMKGDWAIKRPRLAPGGWYFEFENEFYPDIDDTAMVLMALANCGGVEGKQDACRRALEWILGMQGRDGGWASFDVDNNNTVFNNIPFADHNAMLDPSTSDITARMLEMFSCYAVTCDSTAARKAMQFLRKEQEQDGSWYGRWGVNYIYGTWQAIRGLTAIGVDPADPMVRRAARWLESVQNPDGGWGETCGSYSDSALKGQGPSTASQTAWAVMGLICAGRAHSEEAARGIDFLLNTQRSNGTWDEELFTGTGFPRVFYLRYHLYRHSFPLMALGMYRRLVQT